MTETMKRTIDMIHRVPYRFDNFVLSLIFLISLFICNSIYHIVSRVEVIPHGVPIVPNQSRKLSKNPILISNGLIHQGKGLEYAIAAIPSLLETFPNLTYYILGTPHPTGQGTKEYYR